MPVGNPKPQTIASERYQKKAGYISKAFKLKREVAESFAEACEKAGVSQAEMCIRDRSITPLTRSRMSWT